MSISIKQFNIPENGILLALEGMDGSGKSTLKQKLQAYFDSYHIPYYLTSEPTKSEYGLMLRKLLKEKDSPVPLDALMFAVDRYNQYYNEIVPELKQGKIVISDRFTLSSIAYQPLQDESVSEAWVKSINKYIPQPDILIILETDPEIAMKRIIAMGKPLEKFENIAFLTKLKANYFRLFNKINDHLKKEGIYLINTDNLTPDEVLTLIVEEIFPHFF